jgi:acyl-coenzyme A thioesterase PaaI-like protein
MAHHSAGAAASTVTPPGSAVLTAELKISLLRAARGALLRCRARVVKPGRQLAFVESAVWGSSEAGDELVAKASATMHVPTKAPA